MRLVELRFGIDWGTEHSPAPVRVSVIIALAATLTCVLAALLPGFAPSLALGAGVLSIALWLGVAFDAYARRADRSLSWRRQLAIVHSRPSQEPPQPHQPQRRAA